MPLSHQDTELIGKMIDILRSEESNLPVEEQRLYYITEYDSNTTPFEALSNAGKIFLKTSLPPHRAHAAVRLMGALFDGHMYTLQFLANMWIDLSDEPRDDVVQDILRGVPQSCLAALSLEDDVQVAACASRGSRVYTLDTIWNVQQNNN